MPLSALGLVLLAALLHATWNIAAKRGGGDQRFTLLTSLLTCIVWLPAGLWFGWSEVPSWGLLAWGVVLLSAALHLVYFNALLKGYRVGDLTVVYPLARGSAPLITAGAAVLLLGERLSALGAMGVLAVCGGVFLIAGGPGLWQRAHDPAQRERTRAGLRWGLITGGLIAAYSVVDGYAIKALAIGPVVLDYVCNLLRVPLAAAHAAAPPRRPAGRLAHAMAARAGGGHPGALGLCAGAVRAAAGAAEPRGTGARGVDAAGRAAGRPAAG
jgi:uncharacterized membrane protein